MIERFAALAFPRNTFLSANLPIPKLTIQKENVDLALQKHHLMLSAQKKILALCPGAEFGPSKCWPASYYAIVANQKLSEGWSVWIFGSEKDRLIGEEIQTLTNQSCENLAGKTALSDADNSIPGK